MPPLSRKAILRSNNPGLTPEYLFDPDTDPNRLSDQFKQLDSRWEDLVMASSTYQRVVDKMLPIVGFMENGHFVAVAKCDECGKENRWTHDAAPKDARIAFTKFRDRKWQASKKHLTCPQCVARKKQKPVTEFRREPPMKPIAEALRVAVDKASPNGDHTAVVAIDAETNTIKDIQIIAEGVNEMPTETVAPTDKAKVAKRAAYALLLDNYDDKNKRYNGDWSDKRIADTVGMSEAFVAKIREDDFGPAGPPPQLIDLKDRITRLEAAFRAKEAKVLEAMDDLPKMQEELELCKSQLQAIVSAHGWAS